MRFRTSIPADPRPKRSGRRVALVAFLALVAACDGPGSDAGQRPSGDPVTTRSSIARPAESDAAGPTGDAGSGSGAVDPRRFDATRSTSGDLDSAAVGRFSVATLTEGDVGPEVVVLQRMLNRAVDADLEPNGVYGPDTTAAVRRFQARHGLAPTGVADHTTRSLLVRLDGGRSTAVPTWTLPGFGIDDRDGCQVTLVGDSLVALRERIYEAAFTDIGCSAFVDGFSSRSMTGRWLCQADEGRPVESVDAPRAGDLACAPGGLEAIDMIREAQAFGDVLVVALGTNDAGALDPVTWIGRWERVLELAAPIPVVFLTTAAIAGSPAAERQAAYSTALRTWCDRIDRCVLADWALTPTASDSASYEDDVHLTDGATIRRAAFVADVVDHLRDGRLVAPPAPAPTVTWPSIPPSPVTTTTSTTTTSTTTTSTTTTSTTTTSTTTSTTTPGSTTTTSTTTSTDPTDGIVER